MNTTHSHPRTGEAAGTPDTDDEYCLEVRRVLERLLRSRQQVSTDDALDAASDALLRLIPRLADVRSAYPQPHVYAVAIAASAGEDHRRRQRAQRGQGARTVLAADGTVSARRSMASFDPAVHDAVAHDTDETADRASASVLAQRVLEPLSTLDRTLLWRVHAEGQTMGEAAAAVGISRTRATRRMQALLADSRDLIAA